MGFERRWVVQIPTTGAGSQSIDLRHDGQGGLELEAWQTQTVVTNPAAAVSSSSVFIFEGDIGVAEAQGRIAGNVALVDCLMVVPYAGVGKVRIDPDIQKVSVFWPYAVANPSTQLVQLRLRQVA